MTQHEGPQPYGSGDQPAPPGGPETGPAQQPPYGEPAYGQAAYGQAPSGQAAHGQAPTGQAAWGGATYGQAPYGQAPYGQAPYGQAPYGQTPYPQAAYAQAPYGRPAPQVPYPGPYGPPVGYPYAPQRTNGLAIASLVLGILWLYWIGSVLALVFGYLARNQIRQRGEAGAGMATAGIVLGWIGVGILVLAVIAGVASYG